MTSGEFCLLATKNKNDSKNKDEASCNLIRAATVVLYQGIIHQDILPGSVHDCHEANELFIHLNLSFASSTTPAWHSSHLQLFLGPVSSDLLTRGHDMDAFLQEIHVSLSSHSQLIESRGFISQNTQVCEMAKWGSDLGEWDDELQTLL